MTQSAILSTERAQDPRISTVTRFIEALGGSVRLVAAFDDSDYTITFPKEPAMPRASATERSSAWRIRAWDDPRLAEQFIDLGIVAVSEDDIEQPVTAFGSDELLRNKIRERNPERPENAVGTFVTYWRNFSDTMKVGDTIVLAYRDRQRVLKAAIGTVAGDYEYHADEPDLRLRHRRAVRWDATLDRADLESDLRKTVDAPGTIGRFGAPDAGERLTALASKR
ncbi:MAG TPA: hypothetical protein VHA53_00475 [Nitrolancea sp.]|nr:hypothetical protein [Nitrolancea sp.]